MGRPTTPQGVLGKKHRVRGGEWVGAEFLRAKILKTEWAEGVAGGCCCF